jgi:hypothetical protein
LRATCTQCPVFSAGQGTRKDVVVVNFDFVVVVVVEEEEEEKEEEEEEEE